MSSPFARKSASPYPTYKSPHGPKYFYQSHVAGITSQTAIRTGVKTGFYGGVALFTVIFLGSGIPRLQKDILQKIPFAGKYFVHEIPASDNPF